MKNKKTVIEKLTAMEHLINWIDSDCTPMDCVLKAKELLQMEKEQIKDAFVECWQSNVPYGIECKLDAEQYYNETYKQQENDN
jgi:hypothetical protein